MNPQKSWLNKTTSKKEPIAKPQTWKDRQIKENANLIYKVVGKDSSGREAYYFVLIDKNKKEEFLRHRVGDTYNLEDFGKIIYSAYGTFVPIEVQEMLMEKYGLNRFE